MLTGLPPTPAEVDEFVNDPDGIDVAYARAVDRLLDSPRYGERWAQHWLDVIRWAETVGFETNLERPSAWPYRDWVIQSLNEDKPYDRFVFEQLAGDTVGEDAALGFLVAGPANLPGQIGRDEEAMRQSRQDELDEVIRTVSQGLLGLTIGCARCHNHKFDPILQRDYYAMQAIFAGLSYGERRWRGEQNDQWTAKVPEARRRLDQLREELESLRRKHDLRPPLDLLHTEQFHPVIAKSVRMEIAATETAAPLRCTSWRFGRTRPTTRASRNVALASNGATPSASSFALANQTRHFDNLVDGTVDRRQAFPWVAETPGPSWVQIDFASPEKIDRIVWDRGSSVPAEYVIKVLVDDTDQWQTVADTRIDYLAKTTLATANKVNLRRSFQRGCRVDRGQECRGASGTKRIESFVGRTAGLRGKFLGLTRPDVAAASRRPDATARQMAPAIPRVLGDLGLAIDEPEPQRRLALARHLTSADHPLTTRVIVNRVWQHHFGTGLVDTPSDFGQMGSRPTHPELLDRLATDFVEDGWSLKRLHRQIVLSQTFRQAEPTTCGGAEDRCRLAIVCGDFRHVDWKRRRFAIRFFTPAAS